MRRMTFAVIALAGCCAAEARADTLPIIEGVPGTYTPGQSFTFHVLVPQLSNFTSYNVQLVFGTTVPNPPLFVYSTPATPAPSGQYVFPSNSTYQSTASLVQDSPNITLTFADSTGSPVVSTPGVNDAIATVTVDPEAGLTGPIVISVGGGTQFAAQPPEGLNYPTPGPFVVQPNTGGTGGNPVPAPPGAALFVLGGLLLGVRNRLARRLA